MYFARNGNKIDFDLLYIDVMSTTLECTMFRVGPHNIDDGTMRTQRSKNGSATLTASMSQLWKHYQR